MPDLGVLVLDEYQLEEYIGQGAWSWICRATSQHDGQEYAIKILKERGELAGFNPARFEREFESLRRLRSHPHVLSVYRFGEWRGWTLFSMELLKGQTLQEKFKDSDPPRMSVAEYGNHLNQIYAIFEELLDAVHYMHNLGIVHRDLKPGNLMFDADGGIRVMDFGLIKDLQAQTLTIDCPVMGTVPYLAPEQINSREIDPRADLYALGVILYELLTGQRPFSAKNMYRIMMRIIEEEPLPPCELAPHVPAALQRLCLRLLAKDRQHRPSSAKSFLTELMRAKGESELWITSTTIILVDEVIYYVPQHLGNEGNLERLYNVFEKMLEQGAQTVLISGEAGSGKTRLVSEFQIELRRREASSPTGVCSREDVPYQPWLEMVRVLIFELDQARSGWERELSSQVQCELIHFHPEFSARFDGASAMTQQFDGQQKFRRFDALGEFLRLAARVRPLVLHFEDLAGADEDTLAAIAQLAGALDDVPIMFLLCVRLPLVPASDGPSKLQQTLDGLRDDGRLALEIEPAPLCDEDTHQFICGLLSRDDVPYAFSASVMARAHGNPFFTRALVVGLLTGAKADEAIDRMRTGLLEVPVEVQELVEERVRQLDVGVRKLLQTASLVGNPFELKLLCAINDVSEASVLAALDEVERVLLIRPESSSEVGQSWCFVHPLFGEALAARIARPQRRRLHQQIAATLEAWPDRPAASIASHWSDAGEPAQAALHALKAAREALVSEQFAKACANFKLAAAGVAHYCFSVEEEVEIRLGWLKSLWRTGDHEGCLERLREWEDRVGRGSERQMVRILRQQCSALLSLGRPLEAQKVLDRAEVEVSEIDDAVLKGHLDLDQARALLVLEDCLGSLARLTQAFRRLEVLDEQQQLPETPDSETLLRLLEKVGQRDLGLRTGMTIQLAECLSRQSQLQPSLALFMDVLPQPHKKTDELIRVYTGLGSLARKQGDAAQAEAHHQRALELSIRDGGLLGAAANHTALAQLSYRRGSIAQAQEHLRSASLMHQRIGDDHALLPVWELHCEIWFELDAAGEIERTVARALDLFAEQHPVQRGKLALLTGRLALLRLRPERADEQFRRAEKLFSNADTWDLWCRACYYRAQGLLDRGAMKEAHTLIRGLEFSCQDKQFGELLVDVRQLLMQILLDEETEDDSELEQIYAEAEQALELLTMPHKLWRLYFIGARIFRKRDAERAGRLYGQAREIVDQIAHGLEPNQRRDYYDETEKASLVDSQALFQ